MVAAFPLLVTGNPQRARLARSAGNANVLVLVSACPPLILHRSGSFGRPPQQFQSGRRGRARTYGLQPRDHASLVAGRQPRAGTVGQHTRQASPADPALACVLGAGDWGGPFGAQDERYGVRLRGAPCPEPVQQRARILIEVVSMSRWRDTDQVQLPAGRTSHPANAAAKITTTTLSLFFQA